MWKQHFRTETAITGDSYKNSVNFKRNKQVLLFFLIKYDKYIENKV